ncbi:MAG: apolipoprotein N-acyltransferase [Lentisphaeria bacterium]|nr:apolipoprotein N-acyltransferase [Lentisphaeria bacterium]
MNEETADVSGDFTFALSLRGKAVVLLIAFAGGLLYAAALPPLNWSFAGLFTLIPLIYCGIFYRWFFRLLAGWVWGLGWAFFSYNFLREIHPAVPFMLAPVLALWPAVFTLLAGFAAGFFLDYRKVQKVPGQVDMPPWGMTCYLLCAAMLFTILEWTRSRLFVWNDLSVTLWKIPEAMQIARITGRYGVSFLLTSLNGALFALIFCRKRWLPAAILLIYPVIALLYGFHRMHTPEIFHDKVIWKCALIQGDLPQQRFAGKEGIIKAVDTYTNLSEKFKDSGADTIIWPECAVPIPLRCNHPLGEYFRKKAVSLQHTLLLGTLDFSVDGGMTNSALLISPEGRLLGKYDKFHRVPYGEYVPLRTYLPESWIEAFSMGRDLTAGNELKILPVKEDVKAGVAICYEGVFSYVSAGFAANGANVLAALSNDVWYPESSEPEQHLANAVMRCVETGLPMVRCGNNGGSGVVNRRGEFSSYIGTQSARPELLREQASGIVTVELEKNPQLTPAVRYPDWIIALFGFLLVSEFCLISYFRNRGRKKPVLKVRTSPPAPAPEKIRSDV